MGGDASQRRLHSLFQRRIVDRLFRKKASRPCLEAGHPVAEVVPFCAGCVHGLASGERHLVANQRASPRTPDGIQQKHGRGADAGAQKR